MNPAARLRRRCMMIMVICYVLAFARGADVWIPFVAPSAWSPWRVSCVYSLCEWRMDETRLLPTAVQTDESIKSETMMRLRTRAEMPDIRAALLAADLVRIIPEILFLVSLGLSFQTLGKGEVFGRRTITLLRRAAMFALLAAMAQPLAVLAQSSILLTPLSAAERDTVSVYMPIFEALGGLFLASTAWVVAFALDEGRTKQDELAGYI